jgi:cell wall-associated NlpC family hydrolase
MLIYADLLGCEFEYRAEGPDRFDCWSLCREVYARLGRPFPPYRPPLIEDKAVIGAEIERAKQEFTRLDGPEPHCFVTFRMFPPYVTHIGVVMEDCTTFLHVMPLSRVSRERLDHVIWRNKIDGYYRWEPRKT